MILGLIIEFESKHFYSQSEVVLHSHLENTGKIRLSLRLVGECIPKVRSQQPIRFAILFQISGVSGF